MIQPKQKGFIFVPETNEKRSGGFRKTKTKSNMKKSIFESVKANKGFITERDILTLKSRLNKSWENWTEWEQITELFEEPKITPEQSEKGLNWLLNKLQTPTGRERKNNPFDYWQEQIIRNFEGFTLCDFVNMGNFYPFYVPVYTIYGNGGDHFSYYVQGGEIKFY